MESRKFPHSLECSLVPSVMSLLSLPLWSCSRQWFGLWVMQSTQRSGLKFPSVEDLGSVWLSLCFKSNSLRESDLWSVTLGYFDPPLTWVFGRDRGLKSSKGERSLQDQTGMCNKSYSLFKLCWFGGFCFILALRAVVTSGTLLSLPAALYILMTQFRQPRPLPGPPAPSYFHLLQSIRQCFQHPQ